MVVCLTFLFSGVNTHVAQMETICQMARQFNGGKDVECSDDLLKILRVLEPGSKADGKMLETLLQTLITPKESKDREKPPLNIITSILNILMQNLHTMDDHVLNEQLAMLVKIADHLRSPSFPSMDFLTFLKVLESETAYNLEMRMKIIHKFLEYHATLLSWETKFMLEFREFFPSSLESKIILTIINMVKKDLRPLDIAEHLVPFIPQPHQSKAMQIIKKYEKEAMGHNSGSCGMANEELYQTVKTMKEEIKYIKKRQSKSEIMEIMKWPGWKKVLTDEHDYYMFKDMAAYIESSYGQKTFMWLNGMLTWMHKETWAPDLLKQILTMITQNKTVRASIVKSIMADEKLLNFFHKVQYWMKTQNFSKASSHIQMLHQIISKIDFYQDKQEEKWIDGFFNWLYNNFDNSQEWTKVIKSITRSMVDETWMYSLYEELDEKIKVRVVIQHGKIMCNKSLNARKQSIEHILTYAQKSNDLCHINSLEFHYRESVIGKKRREKFVYRINDIQESKYFKWIACLIVEGRIIAIDIDVMYKPKHMEEIHLMYVDPKALS